MAEKFSSDDLRSLRSHLVQLGADYAGASEVIRAFTSDHGISPESARMAALEFGMSKCSLDSIRRALNAAALLA
ncbi:MAG: hypothetical protein ACYC6M_06055 [Terriglobales bacterium]